MRRLAPRTSASGTGGDAGEAASSTAPGGAAGAAASGGETSPASGGAPGGSASTGGAAETGGDGTAGDTGSGGNAGGGGVVGTGGSAATAGDTGTGGAAGAGGDIGTGGVAGAGGEGAYTLHWCGTEPPFPAVEGCTCECPDDPGNECTVVLVNEECFCGGAGDYGGGRDCSPMQGIQDELPWEECALNGCEGYDDTPAWWLEYPDCDRVLVYRAHHNSDTRLFEASTGRLLGAEYCSDVSNWCCGNPLRSAYCWGTGQVVSDAANGPYTGWSFDGCVPAICDTIGGTCPEGTASRFGFTH